MSVQKEIQDFHNQMEPLDKESRRLASAKLATAMTQRNPLGTTDPGELLLMRHSFVYLPTEDISKYISNFMLGVDNTPREAKRLWIGEPPMWASVCRMMYASYNKTMWQAAWKTDVRDLGKANAQVLAGMYSVAYDKKYYAGWADAVDESNSVWLNPDLFADWERVQQDTKLKIWMVVSSKKDPELLRQFANSMGWSLQWSLAENLLGENLFHPDHALREISFKQLLLNKNKIEMYDLPTLDM